MISPDDTTYTTTTGAGERASRQAMRRGIINEKRQRHTDVLPAVSTEASNGKVAARQLAQLREEYKRLRWELEDLQHYKNAHEQLEREIEAIHSSHQLEIEQYQHHLRDMMEERNQMQEINHQLEQRYQELYHSFHETVEEEANKLVSEAARTLVLAPEHTPALLHDVVKTLEFQVKQTEDQHVAEILSLMRQAQRKAHLLEKELASERAKIAEERQNILVLQHSISEQAKLRYKTLRAHLQTRWITALTFMTTGLLVLLAVFQLTLLSFGVPLYVALFSPIVICMVLASAFARMRVSSSTYHASKYNKAKTAADAKTDKSDKPAASTGKNVTKKL